ncbi:HAMP domain-containing histidine kinase [Streptomyces spororaveus]|uniref:sensor histidine kinase n=1 Tax=Streptomyces spororaveus TaxID=284039 RepID=UPI002079E975|nr:HAMP domain-containing sensor histidine kinase [Streptomyces spororaveus]MCM9080753.1 HAMP domain-containing histidine kinase [Streptomyces spororaveus]
MRALSSLRWKIALTTTMVCCMVALALGILVHNVVARQMVGEVRKAAATELDHALGHYEYGTAHGDVNAVFDPPDLPRRLRELVASGQTGSIVGVQGGKPVMWAAGPADDKALAVWLPFGSTRERLRDIDTAILASAILAAGLVALAGLFLADRISRRLATTAAVARRITAGDLDARVNFPHEGDDAGPRGSRDEVRDVAHALDSMASSLQGRLEAEKRFTADVAHELRTPLTGSLAAAALLPEGRPKEMINNRLRALHLLTEDLLEISRLDSGVERADLARVELGRAVERAVAAAAGGSGAAPEGGPAASVRVVQDMVVVTDRRRLDRILANLLVNAGKHGRPPVEVTVEGPVVVVRDHGPGYPPELIEQGPQRFRTGDPGRGRGHGLGLTIVMGQAAVLEIAVGFANAPDGGAVTTLRLPVGRVPPGD